MVSDLADGGASTSVGHDPVDGEEQPEGDEEQPKRAADHRSLHMVRELAADRATGNLAEGELAGQGPVDVPQQPVGHQRRDGAITTSALRQAGSIVPAGLLIGLSLVLALGFDMPAAVGTSLLVIAINSAAALAARLGGHVHLAGRCSVCSPPPHWPGRWPETASPPGSTRPRLTTACTVLLIAVAAYSLTRSLPGLV